MDSQKYESPMIEELGTLTDLTEAFTPKDRTGEDGFVFESIVLGPVS
jgi:hypothetical protein